MPDSLDLSDSLGLSVVSENVVPMQFTDELALFDRASQQPDVLPATDTLAFSDALNLLKQTRVQASDDMALTDPAPGYKLTGGGFTSDQLNLLDQMALSLQTGPSTRTLEVADTLTLSDVMALTKAATLSESDTVELSGQQALGQVARLSLSDTLEPSDTGPGYQLSGPFGTDTLTTSDQLTLRITSVAGPVTMELSGQVDLSDAVRLLTTRALAGSDQLDLTSTLTLDIVRENTLLLSGTLTVGDALSMPSTRVVGLGDTLALSDALAVTRTGAVAGEDTVALSDSLLLVGQALDLRGPYRMFGEGPARTMDSEGPERTMDGEA